jgi:hypothetical protein
MSDHVPGKWRFSLFKMLGYNLYFPIPMHYSARITFSASLGSMQNISDLFSVSPKLEHGLK